MSETNKVPFRFEIVGSFLRPIELKEARDKFSKGEISAEELKVAEDKKIKELVEKQKSIGLKVATDGEFRRSWWNLDFYWGLQGVQEIVTHDEDVFKGIKLRGESAILNM